MDLTKHVIHDEASASVGGETEISRELHISEAEYKRKMDILDRLCVSKLSGDFVSCSLTKKTEKEALYQLWTNKQAVLNVNLSKRYGGKCYLGTRSSPTRILTGQNVVEMKEVSRVEKVMARLSCTAFEARTILMFSMISKTVKKCGMSMFTAEEMQDIKARRLNVATVGFATYSDFGSNRDDVLHLLGYLGSYQVSMEKDQFPLVSFLGGGVSCKTWRKVVDAGYQGPNQGVVFSKADSGHSLLVKQMFYLKDEEIVAKDNRHNEAALSALPDNTISAFKSRLVRCDNTFFKRYLKQWVDSQRAASGLAKLPEGDLLLKDIAHILDNKELVVAMCRVAANELGIRSLLLSPTLAQIHALDLEGRESSLLENWKENCRLTVTSTSKGKRLDWPDVIGSNPKNRRVAERLYADYYLDITLPYDFYASLTEARFRYFLQPDEQRALTHQTTGDVDRYNEVDLENAKRRIRGQVYNLVSELRSTLNLTTVLNKKHIVSNFK